MTKSPRHYELAKLRRRMRNKMRRNSRRPKKIYFSCYECEEASLPSNWLNKDKGGCAIDRQTGARMPVCKECWPETRITLMENDMWENLTNHERNQHHD